MARLEEGDTVIELDRRKGWSQIAIDEAGIAWVYSKLLEPAPEPEPEAAPVTKKQPAAVQPRPAWPAPGAGYRRY